MSIRKISTVLCAVFAVGLIAIAAEETKFKALCPLSGKAVLEDKTADYKGAKVQFCCPNCPGAFSKDPAKFAVKANHQLAGTGQFVQTKCPLSGGKLNPEQFVTVSDVKVQFCCENCKGKVDAAKGDEQLSLVFADKAFDKGFELKKK